MRRYEEIIREAELLASPPAAVVAYLEGRSQRLLADRFCYEGDEALEQALLGRQDALIDLALAQHCRHAETAKTLFFRDGAGPGLRLAVLTNRTMVTALMGSFPGDLFDGDKAALVSYLSGASETERSALFENPSLNSAFLSDFLDGDECWIALDEPKQLAALHSLQQNMRMHTEYKGNRYDDGWDNYQHSRVFDSAWKLAGRVPTTPQWAAALSALYDKMPTVAISIDDPMALAERWQASAPEQTKNENYHQSHGYLNDYQGVRHGLARLARRKPSCNRTAMFSSDDPAVRCAVYSDTELKAEFMQQAYERDGALAYNYLVRNARYWDRPEARAALQEMARNVDSKRGDGDMDSISLYGALEEKFSAEHPEWFAEEATEDADPSELPATKGDLEQLESNLSAPAYAVADVGSTLAALNKKVGFVFWFSLGALVASVVRF